MMSWTLAFYTRLRVLARDVRNVHGSLACEQLLIYKVCLNSKRERDV